MSGEGPVSPGALVDLTSRVAKLISASQTLHQAAKIVIDDVCETMRYPVGHLYVLDADEESLVPSDVWFVADDMRSRPFVDATMETRFVVGEGSIGRAARRARSVVVEDVRTHLEFKRRCPAKNARLKGGYAFPILHTGQLYGVLEFYDDIPGRIEAAAVEAIEACASLVGVIAEREKTRSTLARGQLRIILESSPEAVVIADARGKIVAANAQADAMFGWGKGELLGRSVFDVILAPEAIEQSRIDGRLLFGDDLDPKGGRVETSGLRRTGERFPMEIAVWATEIDGTFLIYGFVHDLSAQDASREAARVAERRIQDAMVRVGMGEWELDLLTGRVDISDQALAIAGYTADEVADTIDGVVTLVHPDDEPMVIALIEQAMNHGETMEYETRVLCPDASVIWVRARVETEYDTNKRPVRLYGTVWDITDMKKDGDTAWFRVVHGSPHRVADTVRPHPHRSNGDVDLPHLTERELEILLLLRDGFDVTKIARELDISIHTARDHLKRIRAKLGVQSQLQAVVKAADIGLLSELG